MEEPPPLTLHNELPISTNPNQLDILSQLQQAPSTRNTQGFNLLLPVEANSGTTGGQPFVDDLSNDFFNGSASLDTGRIFGDPSFSLNESWPVGTFEDFMGDDMALDHSINLLDDNDTYSLFRNSLFS